MNCPRCGAANSFGRRMCGACGTDLPGNFDESSTPEFRDPKKLTRWLQGLLIANVAATLVEIAYLLSLIRLLNDNGNAGVGPQGEIIVEAMVNNLQGAMVVTFCTLMLAAVTFVVFLTWIYRMSSNVRALGARELKFTPGWAVGWYFIPIVSLWMPFLAMREIVQVSKNPGNWRSENGGWLLGWWWFLWVSSGIIYFVITRLNERTLETAERIAMMFIGENVLSIASLGAALVLVARVYRYQAGSASHAVSEVFA